MGDLDLTRATTTPRTSNHGRATKPRTSGTGRRIARGRCSHLLSPSSASASVAFANVVSRGDTSGGTAKHAARTSTTDSIGVLSHSGRRLGCAPGVAIWLWRGATCCVRCRELTRQRYKPGAAAVRSKRQLEDRKARAVCTICCAPTATGRLRCPACLADSRARHTRDRAHWRAAGRCVSCGRPPRRGVKVCGVCAERKKKLRATNQAAGYCRCGRFVTPWPEGLLRLSHSGAGISAQSAGLNSLHVVRNTTCSTTRRKHLDRPARADLESQQRS